MVGHPLFGPGPSHGTTDNQPRTRPASGTARRARLDLRSDEFKAATELPWPVPFLGDISSRGLFKSYSPSTAPLNRWAWALNSLSVLDLAKIAAVGDGFLSAEGVTIRLGLGVLLGIGGRAPRAGRTQCSARRRGVRFVGVAGGEQQLRKKTTRCGGQYVHEGNGQSRSSSVARTTKH